MKRYVTSVEVEAVHWIGTDSSYQEILELLEPASEYKISYLLESSRALLIEIDKKYSLTLSVGGYLIRGIAGQYFIMPEEEFNDTYTLAEAEDENKEIERKFLVKDPKNITLDLYPSHRYKQYYISLDPEIRIRSIDNKVFKLTIKSSGDLVRNEFEIDIPKELYLSLISLSIRKMTKTRYAIDNFELDVYDDYDFATIEVEFKSEEEADSFIPPDWFGEEVTYDSKYKNKNLATKI